MTLKEEGETPRQGGESAPPREAVPDRQNEAASSEQEAVADHQDQSEAASSNRAAQGEEVESDTETETLDLTDGPIPPSTIPYSIDRDREQKRGLIALILVGLLVVVVLLSFLGLFTARIELKDLKELLIVILSPLVALVGAATGFYFGEKNTGKS